jgi:hypothetical protein
MSGTPTAFTQTGRLTARDAFRMATETSQADRAAYFKIRDQVYRQISTLAQHRPPCFKTRFEVSPTFPGIPEYNVRNVFVLLVFVLHEDGYTVLWDKEEPLTLHIDWSLKRYRP